MKSKIYINDELVGYTRNPIDFTREMRYKRRNGEISHEMSITYYEDTDDIHIYNDPGRARRPLIIVNNGRPRLKPEHLSKIERGTFRFEDLLTNGIIEFLDANEEENSYIAMSLADLNKQHTHLEIDPATMLGICAGVIPFAEHNSSPRNTMESGMTKQALGLYVSNYAMRTDIRAHLLHHPQTPIVKTRSSDSTNYDLRPSGQNFVVAVLSYEGYNMEDAIVFNKSSLERGLARSTFFRTYDTSEKRYAGGQVDRFQRPDFNVQGYRSEEAYKNLDDDGIIFPESYVESGEVLIGKTSPPRFLDEFGTIVERRRETSVTVRHGEKGIVDAVLVSETSEGSRLAKVRVRDTRQPEYGDKFASRHGQKGVMGLIVEPEDMPFTESGLVPDIIINPHVIPSRMSLGQMLEMVSGKAGCLEGERVDGTPFNQTVEDEIKQQLMNNGFEASGCESMYDGVTGERFETEIFMGIAYYQKLHHMTTDKIYARSRGPVQVITRQPTEGRAREGGLRFGEMERDCLIAHGAAMTLKERLLDESDKYEAIVCGNCGMLAVFDKYNNKRYCPICGDVKTYPIESSYAFKLLLDELKSMCIFPKLVLSDKTEFKKPFKKKHYSFKVKPLEENPNFISRIRLSDEEQSQIGTHENVKLEYCEICGKKLNKNQMRLCKSCARKQYASRIIKKLSGVVKPNVPFKKSDLRSLNLVDLQVKDYIWTLQEFDLIDVDNNKLKLKDEQILNEFRVSSGFDPIDFGDIKGLEKICKICGKTLPVSQFYKSSEGYEDICKICKKHSVTAKYLEDVIKYIGFNVEFSQMDLNEYISNNNQVIGMIWSLQDNDLLLQNENEKYVLANESKCLKFLKDYNSNFNYDDLKSKDEVKNIPKSTVNEKFEKSDVEPKSKVSVNNVKYDAPKSKNLYKKQMKIVLNARKNGKTREEAAKLANIPLYKINHWYKEGKQGLGKDNIEFYKRLKRIEDGLLNSVESNERKQMDFILKLLRQGKSKQEVADFTELDESTLTRWYNQGREKRNVNTAYFYNEVQKIKNEIIINKTSVKTDVAKKSSKSNNKSAKDKQKIEKDRIKGKELRLQIKKFIPKFEKLDEKIAGAPADKIKANKLRKEVKLNIKMLKSSARLRKIDKLENNLSQAIESYDNLSHRVNVFLDDKECSVLIKENSTKIIKLRKKYAYDPEIISELSEISFLNVKLNANLKNGKKVSYEDALGVKDSLINLENNSKNSSKSINKQESKISKHIAVNKSSDMSNITNQKSNDTTKELLNVLYGITGNSEISLKYTFIDYLNSKNLTEQDGIAIRSIVKNEIDDGVLKNSDEIELRLEEVVAQKQLDQKNDLLKFLYSIVGSDDVSINGDFLSSNSLSNDEGIKIRDCVKNEIDEGVLKTCDKIKFRLDELVKQQLRKHELLDYLYSIVGKNDVSLKDSFIHYLSLNNLSSKKGIKIRDCVKNEIDEGVLKTCDEIDFRLDELVKQEIFKQELLEFLYSISKSYDNSHKRSLNSYNSSINLFKIDIIKITNRVKNEILKGFLKSFDDVNLRFDELVTQKQQDYDDDLLKFLNLLTGSNDISLKVSFTLYLQSNNLTNQNANTIKNILITEIKMYRLKTSKDVVNRLDELVNKKRLKYIGHLLDFLYSLVGSDDLSVNGDFLSSNSLSNDAGIEIRDCVKNEIDEGILKTRDSIELRLNELVKQKQLDNKKELLEFLYSITGSDEDFPTDSFSSYLKLNNLLKDDGIEIRDCVKNEIDDGILITSNDVNLRLNELTKQKQAKYMNELVEYLRSLTEDIEKRSSLSTKFSDDYLDLKDVKKIKKQIVNEINSSELKSKEEIKLRLNELLEQNNIEKFNKLLDEFYMIVGKNNISDTFLKILSDNELSASSGNYIKKVVKEKINNNSIKNKIDLGNEINNAINDEINRQNKAIDKLNALFKEDNIYLKGIASNEKYEIKNSVEKSIKENRLDYLNVYSELKKTIEEFKIIEDDEKTNENDEDKSSGGFLSNLRRIFSKK